MWCPGAVAQANACLQRLGGNQLLQGMLREQSQQRQILEVGQLNICWHAIKQRCRAQQHQRIGAPDLRMQRAGGCRVGEHAQVCLSVQQRACNGVAGAFAQLQSQQRIGLHEGTQRCNQVFADG
ncbi:hypothetical protein D3C72_1561350 [compost metagenome]